MLSKKRANVSFGTFLVLPSSSAKTNLFYNTYVGFDVEFF